MAFTPGNDEATWEWSDNGILCAFDWRFHGFRKLNLNKFDLAHIMEQANIYDEMVSYAANGNNSLKSVLRAMARGRLMITTEST